MISVSDLMCSVVKICPSLLRFCAPRSWQPRLDHLQRALLIGQRPESARSCLQVHEPCQSSRHVELPQGNPCSFSPLLTVAHEAFASASHTHPSFPASPSRVQLSVSTWSQPRPASSWLHSCPSSCLVCIATSLTRTWAFARPWPASGTRWSLIRPW